MDAYHGLELTGDRLSDRRQRCVPTAGSSSKCIVVGIVGPSVVIQLHHRSRDSSVSFAGQTLGAVCINCVYNYIYKRIDILNLVYFFE
jgi:hypothetical protein